MKRQKNILVAPLHWGLGHATRCIPIINELLAYNYNVIIGSDGAALLLLRKEFPQLKYIELPPYNIIYPKKGEFFKLKLFLKLPEIKKTITEEKEIIKKLVEENKIQGIISDNRFGIRHKKVPSVFITHQLNVLSGNTSFFSSKMHQKIIKKYDACWVPDLPTSPNLSGKLGHPKKLKFPVNYMGLLSRMKKRDLPIIYDVLVLLSGPEPQRTLLENKMIASFLGTDKKVFLVKGVVEDKEQTQRNKNITMVNFLKSEDLEMVINQSRLVVSRSGYTTIMDLAALEKDAFFVPTPGQFEQQYLAKELKRKGIVASCRQKEFTLKKLKEVPLYSGLKNLTYEPNFQKLFTLFEGE